MVIDLKSRTIISVPTQIGCAIGCTFCISSLSDFVRHLKYDEIIDLVDFGIEKSKNKSDILVSFTGEGEPFLNSKNVNNAILNIEHRDDIHGFRVCTSGIRPNLISTIVSNKPLYLQLSLHSPFDNKRKELIPNTKPIRQIIDSVIESETNYTEISINYVLMQGFNDSLRDLEALKALVSKNWNIKLNPLLEDGQYKQSNKIDFFYSELLNDGYLINRFKKIGSNIKGSNYSKLSYTQSKFNYDKSNAIMLEK